MILNYIDLIIFAILIFYMIRGVKYGFLNLFGRLVSLLGCIVLVFVTYRSLADWLAERFELFPNVAFAISFLLLFVAYQALINVVIRIVINNIPQNIKEHKLNKTFGVLPGFIDGAILVSLLAVLVVIAPISHSVKDDLSRSATGQFFVSNVVRAEHFFNDKFGGLVEETLTFLTVRPETDEMVSLPFKPSRLSVNLAEENRMLELINEERRKEGAPPLVVDESLVLIARNHSQDMWERQYFSHIDPDGRSPFERIREGGVSFLRAGENLALAQTVELAHRGLMNSPGHRRNIMDPNFRKVGIGVVDGGIYGKMYTQKFTN